MCDLSVNWYEFFIVIKHAACWHFIIDYFIFNLGNVQLTNDHDLILKDVTLENSGKYSCVASNVAGVASRNHTVNVQGMVWYYSFTYS